VIGGPQALVDLLTDPAADAGRFGAVLASALPPLLAAEPWVGEQFVGPLANLLARAAAEGRRPPDLTENSWRTRLPPVVLGLADHPVAAADPPLTAPALARAWAAVRRLDRGTGEAGGVWVWRRNWEPPAGGLPPPGLLTGRHLTATIAALAYQDGGPGVGCLQGVLVAERPAVAPVADPLIPGGGGRLGLGPRLGRTATVAGAVVEVRLRATLDRTAVDRWRRLLVAATETARRVVPAHCRVRVRVWRPNHVGPAGTTLGGPWWLGEGLALGRRDG
jgi:hypothetical protein